MIAIKSIYRLLVEHHTAISTSINLVDRGSIVQIHLCILCPSILTITGTKHLGRIFHTIAGSTIIDQRIDINLTIERTTGIVVSAIDTTRHQVALFIQILINPVTLHNSISTVIVDVGFKHVTGNDIGQAIGTTKNTVQVDGRAYRHIHDGSPRDTLLVTGSIDIFQMTTHQVDDCRSSYTVSIVLGYCRVECGDYFNRRIIDCSRCCSSITHTHTTIVTSAKDFRSHIFRYILRHVNEHIATILHGIPITIADMTESMSLSSTINLRHRITTSIVGFKVDEGIFHPRLIIA